MPDEDSVDSAKLGIEQQEDVSEDPTVAILAEVLCVFAARGRALREERAKRDMDPPETTTVEEEHDDQNSQ